MAPASIPSACDQAYDHIEFLTLQGMSKKDAADQRRDLEINRPAFDRACADDPQSVVTDCILQAGTLDDAAVCGAGAQGASTQPASREAAPSAADCQQAFDHLETLVLAELPPKTPPDVYKKAKAGVEEKRTEVTNACINEGTPDTVRCILAAKTIADTDLCGQ
jgi:hypothetical protein